MKKEPSVSLFELVTALSEAADLVSPVLVNHHKMVAYFSLRLGTEMGLSIENIRQTVLAGALHDIGALSIRERLEALHFEVENPYQHAETGYHLMKAFPHFSKIAEFIRFHHVWWNYGEGKEFRGHEVPIESHILHLADRISVLIHKDHQVLSQVGNIREQIVNQSEIMFHPDAIEAFKSLADKEYFWLDSVSNSIHTILKNRLEFQTVLLDLDAIIDLANIFSQIIDFRCKFTANHSSGVAASAEKLAQLAAFSERDRKMMKVAGYLHDLGKLAVPVDIINKPSGLSDEEFQIIKSHTYYTYRILEQINGFEKINSWASFHHECLDGGGYPFHLGESELCMGSRIVAVADVFTAVTEDRPYRAGMDKKSALQVLRKMADKHKLDPDVVMLLKENFEEVNVCRLLAQEVTGNEYHRILEHSDNPDI